MKNKYLPDRKNNILNYLSGAVGAGALAPVVGQAAVIAFTPSGVSTTAETVNLLWDMASSGTTTNTSPGGIYDFQISDHADIHMIGTDGVVSTAQHGNAVRLATGTLIGSGSLFSTDYTYLVGFGTTPGYIGVRFTISGQTHYGWAKIQISGGNHSVTAWAYESQPNTAIQAGAGAVPEASSALLALAGIGGATLRRRRKAA